jgi:anti-sigma-K factor RskA
MSGAGCEERRDSIAAHLLGALEPVESADLERHLELCSGCREDLAWLRPAVEVLPESVEPVDPRPALRSRVLEEAFAERSRPQRSVAARRRAPRIRPRLLAALASIGILLAALGGYLLRDGGSQPGPTVVAAVGSAPGMTATLTRSGESGMLRLAHLRPMSPDVVLEAWVRRAGRSLPVAGLFVPDSRGRATTMIPDLRGVDAVMVTAEPHGGSSAPTSAPMVTLGIDG